MIKFDHTRIRVSNLERSIKFYSDHCGFQVVKRNDKSPSGNQIVHMAIPGSEHMLELTYSPDYKLNVQEDSVHTCIRVSDIIAHCDAIEKAGIAVWPDNWREKFSTGGRKMAFITDPDKYEVEILEIAGNI